MRKTVFRLAIVAFLTFCLIQCEAPAAQGIADAIQTRIRHADSYYSLGLEEKGNVEAFRDGLDHLREAAGLLGSASLSSDQLQVFKQQIEALRVDIENQIRVHETTFYAVFPLVRLLTRSTLSQTHGAGTYELIRDPRQQAVNLAGHNLRDEVIARSPALPQMHVIFTSIPNDDVLENQLAFIFNSSPRFFVHNYREVSQALLPHQLAAFNAGTITPEMKTGLCRAFNISDLLVVTIHMTNQVDGNHFYLLDGRLFNPARNGPTHTFSQQGMIRDRREQRQPIIITNLLLMALALMTYPILLKHGASAMPSWPVMLTTATAGFALGRLIPLLLVPMITPIAPAPTDPVILSWWWPCLLGLALFIGPALICRLASIRIGALASTLDMQGRGEAFRVAVALGVCAYLSGPLLLYLRDDAPKIILPLALCGSLILYLLGRCFNTVRPPNHPGPLVAFAIIATAILVPTVLHLQAAFVWSTALITTVAAAFCIRNAEPKPRASVCTGPVIDGIPLPADVSELARLSGSPPYQAFESYRQAMKLVEPFLQGKTAWLQLTGPNGAGKTATAAALIAEITATSRRAGKEPKLHKGECTRATGDPIPYAPFQKLLVSYFGINLAAPPEPQLQQIDTALGSLLESVIPFFSILFPAMTPHANPARDREDIFESVACIFERAAEKTPIILFIEDLHSIDAPSGELLRRLLNRFQPGKELPILFLLTTGKAGWMGSDAADAAKAMQCFTVEIRLPDWEQRAQILSTGLGLDCDVAMAIVHRVGNIPVKGGELFMLFRYVSDLTEKGYLVKSGERFVWSEVYKGDDKLPTPDTIATMLADCWQKNPAYRDALECAACQGPEFSASVLSGSLGTEHFKLLRQLREIEETSGLIRDIIIEDDRYEFCSRLVFDAIRASFGNVALGPRAANVSKVVREYHALTAAAMEATFSRSSSRICEIANLYYAAGARHAPKAIESCMKAARAARNMLAFSDAVQYVRKARECSNALGQPLPMEEEELLLIHCHQAHVVGEASLRVRAAEYVRSYLEKHADPSEEVLAAAARTLYEAAKDKNDRELFEKAVEVGRRMVQRERSTLEKSEGLHFIGISLPPAQASERERYLREAYEILETCSRDDLAAQALLARVANSLAEQLSYQVSSQGHPEVATAMRDEIRTLFLLSLEIKSRPELLDKPGQARTHGGLGRMYLKLEPRDLPSARKHLMKDLELSRDLQDMTGQCQMLSLLGECDLEEGKFSDALDRYQQSLQLASSVPQRLFALAGTLASADRLHDQERLQTAGLQILEIVKHHEPIDNGLVEKIHSTLATCSLCAGEPWREELLEMINNTVQPDEN